VRVLLVGGGGREHGLARKLARRARLDRPVAAPGNPGIGAHATCVPVADTAIGDLAVLSGEKASGRR
jgi:phosphoribosylamine--glycine ligase